MESGRKRRGFALRGLGLSLCVGSLFLTACASAPVNTVPPPATDTSRPPVEVSPRPNSTPDPTSPTPPPSAAQLGPIETARGWLGVPYRYGGQNRNGVDCSALMRKVFAQHGIRLPRTSREQFGRGTIVERGRLRPGDLVFFRNSSGRIFHVGLVSGPGRYIHASTSRKQVIEDRLNSPWAKRHFAGGRRLLAPVASR